MTPMEEHRFFARLMADHADEWAAKWAAQSQDGQADSCRQVTDPAAVATLQRAYAAVLRRGGQDYVERITMTEAHGFPSFPDVAPDGASDAWLAAGLKNRDLPFFGLFIASGTAFGDVGEREREKRGRAQALAILARMTRPE